MAKQVSARLDEPQVDGIQSAIDDGTVDSSSEAIRQGVDYWLAEYGYKTHTRSDTTLRQAIRRAADSSALLGVLWVGMTYLFPIGFRVWAIPIFLIAVTFYGVDRLLARIEPAVSNRLRLWSHV